MIEVLVEKSAAAEKICAFDRHPTDWMRAFFPPGFPFLEEAAAVGVKIIAAVRCPPGCASNAIADLYKILISPEIDWLDMQGRLNCNFPDLGIRTREDARAFMFLHECGHMERREVFMEMKDIDGRPVCGIRELKGLEKIRKSQMRQGKNLTEIEKRISAHRLAIRREEKAADAYAVGRFQRWKGGR